MVRDGDEKPVSTSWADKTTDADWAGWVYAADADTGVWKWRLKSNYPIVGGMTPTAGGLVFFGDVGGNFYALDAATGEKLWGQKIGGAIGGGVIAYKAGGGEKIAVTTGFTARLANRSRDRQDRGARPRRRAREADEGPRSNRQ